jgi:hypothetical protein
LLYILFGSWTWFTPQPHWARIVFAPGLFTGGWAHELLFRHVPNGNVDILASEAVGVVTMGLIFGGMGCLMRIGMAREKSI